MELLDVEIIDPIEKALVTSIENKMKSTECLLKILSALMKKNELCMTKIASSKLVPILVQILKCSNAFEKYTNLCIEYTACILLDFIKNGAIKVGSLGKEGIESVLHILNTGSTNGKECAIQLVSIISYEQREILLELGIVALLISTITNNHNETIIAPALLAVAVLTHW